MSSGGSGEATSCEECRVEMADAVWTNLLINWLNYCVIPQAPVTSLNLRNLVEIINKYKSDICYNDIDRAILCTDDLEPFLRYKYPILRLRYLNEEKELPKKLLIMTSMLLFHCVTNSKGAVDEDICATMDVTEQEIILKFCEELIQREVTIFNIESSYREACQLLKQNKIKTLYQNFKPDCGASDYSVRDSDQETNKANLKFKASVMVMPSAAAIVPESPDYSRTSFIDPTESELSEMDKNVRLYKLASHSSKEKLKDKSSSQYSTADKKRSGQSMESCECQDCDTGSDCCCRNPSVCQCEPSLAPSPPNHPSSGDISHLDLTSSNYEKLNEHKYSDIISFKKVKWIDNQKGKRKNLNDKQKFKNMKKNVKDGEKLTSKRNLEQQVENRSDDTESKRKSLLDSSNTLTDSERTSQLENERITKNLTKTEKKMLSQNYKDLKKNEIKASKAMKQADAKLAKMEKKNKKEMEKNLQQIHDKEKKINKNKEKKERSPKNKRKLMTILAILLLLLLLFLLIYGISAIITKTSKNPAQQSKHTRTLNSMQTVFAPWKCRHHLCEKLEGVNKSEAENIPGIYLSLSRCVIECSGPQVWPLPIGHTTYSKSIVALTTQKMEYKLQSIPSDAVSQHLSEAFKIFISNLIRQEKMHERSASHERSARRMGLDIPVRELSIHIDVDFDDDPRMRVDTDESYMLKIETLEDKVMITVNSASFCGVRHGLETLSQIILFDHHSGYLITDSNILIKDAPSFRYRGLMLDTGRNFIPLNDIMRTIDAMSSCKLNTFHWRISDVTSFPLVLKSVPKLHEYGAYDKKIVYTEEDVKTVVKYAGLRGVRVLMEVAAPGPVGRPWSWNTEATCPTKNVNTTCENILCLRLNMKNYNFDILQQIYIEILNLTKVNDIFHLGDGLFSVSNCHSLLSDREGFLERALDRLKRANGGFLPKLPIVWYSKNLRRTREAHSWERYGVELHESFEEIGLSPLERFRIIHSTTWTLSCELKKQRCKKYRTWQQMYMSRFWQNFKEYTNEGGEALVWTDFVGPGGLDQHIWPRAAAVAERLWSDIKLSTTVSDTAYLRLDFHRRRMLQRGVTVQPIWPAWCSYQPRLCLQILKKNNKISSR